MVGIGRFSEGLNEQNRWQESPMPSQAPEMNLKMAMSVPPEAPLKCLEALIEGMRGQGA